MKILSEQVKIVPGYRFGLQGRNQSCNYYFKDLFLYQHLSFFPWNFYKEPNYLQQFKQFSLTKEECDKIVKPYGEFAHSQEHHYAENTYFPSFCDDDKALEFCNSDEFEKLSKSLEKINGI